jgi:hypothetical protein
VAITSGTFVIGLLLNALTFNKAQVTLVGHIEHSIEFYYTPGRT